MLVICGWIYLKHSLVVYFDSCCETSLEMDVGSLLASSSLWCWWWTLNEMVCCSLTMICQIWAPWLWEWSWGRIRASGPAWAQRPGWSRHLRRAQPQPAPPAARDQRSGETENKSATLEQCQWSGWFSWEYRHGDLDLDPCTSKFNSGTKYHLENYVDARVRPAWCCCIKCILQRKRSQHFVSWSLNSIQWILNNLSLARTQTSSVPNDIRIL